MTQNQTYFRPTTVQQRRLLFEAWKQTGSVKQACLKAHVSKRVFYRWEPRFQAGGYPALEKGHSHAPKNPHRIPEMVAQKVVNLKTQHPQWGKRTIASELAKKNSWVPLVSPNTVRRILQDAGLFLPQKPAAKKGGQSPSVEPPPSRGRR